VRKTIFPATWEQVKTAYASGIGLRELGRNMGIPSGTILSRAKREGWTRQIQSARAIVPAQPNRPTTSTAEAVAVTMRERGQKHLSRMGAIAERGVAHVEGMDGAGILDAIEDIDRLDRIGRRAYGLEDGQGDNVVVPIQINLNCG
jgi:hypothetical protein